MVDPNNSFWLSTTQAPVVRDTACEQLLNGLKPDVVILDVQPQINVLLLLTVALIHLVTLS